MDGLKVLLACSDKLLQSVVQDFFERRRVKHMQANSAEQALAKLAVQNFDLLIVGNLVGSIKSSELIRRAKISLPNLIVILLTDDVSRENMIQALRFNVFDIIQRPMEQRQLLEVSLERAMERIQLLKERDSLLESLRARNQELETSLNKLNEAYEQLVAHEEELEADLRRAQLMQQNLLPGSIPGTAEFEYFGFYNASDSLGGDFFGYLPLGENKMGVYLADVSGHGVRAAMVTVIVRELLHGQLLHHPGENPILERPAHALGFLNRGLLDESFDSPVHATMVYAVVDYAKNEITYSRAGHPAPILCFADGRLSRLQVGGPGLGLETAPQFRTQTIPLASGSFCLFFSDGLTQALGAKDEFTAASALGRVLRGARETSASRIAERIEHMTHGTKYGRIEDDISFLLIHRHDEINRHKGNGHPQSVKIISAQPTQPHPMPPSRIEMGWDESVCLIRVIGQATWQLGPAFQEVIEEAKEARASSVYVDLIECESLDSTMLGLINHYADMLIFSATTERVERQLQELGVSKHLHVAETALPDIRTVVRLGPEMTRDQRAQLMLEAHESLLQTSEANRERFSGVVESLRHRQPGK